MDVTLELVEQLRKYADVSYSDAKQALEETQGDLLDALIWLEHNDKIDLAGVNRYHTGTQAPPPPGASAAPTAPAAPQAQEGFWRRAWRMLTENRLECSRKDTRFEVPLAVLIALLIFAVYMVVVLLLVGFCLGWRFHFAGPQLGRKEVNDVMENIDNAAESIRETVRRNFRK